MKWKCNLHNYTGDGFNELQQHEEAEHGGSSITVTMYPDDKEGNEN